MNNAIVIIDFDNYFTKDINEYSKTQIEYLFSLIVRHVYEHNNIKEIQIRLYGGWYQDDDLTNRASNVIQKISSIDIFPIIRGHNKIDGNIEIVDSLYGINYVWHNTYREKKGIPHLRINYLAKDDKCESQRHLCPVHILSKFTKGKNRICINEGCTTKHAEVFFQKEQKMVDTMIACDLLSYSEEVTVDCLYLISDDVDHFPALALCAKKKEKLSIFLGVKNNKNISLYKSILTQFNINLFSLS